MNREKVELLLRQLHVLTKTYSDVCLQPDYGRDERNDFYMDGQEHVAEELKILLDEFYE